MPLSRRSFLVTGSLAAGALATVKPFAVKAAKPADLQDWSVRHQFDLDPSYAVPFARLAFGIMKSPQEVEMTARAVRSLT